MDHPHICVLGSITLDILFRMSRFPVPGETLFANEYAVLPGGKGLNQAIAAARLGARASLIGRVGADAFGDLLLATAAADAVDTAAVVRDPVTATGMAIPIVVPSGDNAILASGGANLAVTTGDIEAAADAIRASAMLLLQFETPAASVTAAIATARAAGVPVLLNPAPVREFDHALLRDVDVLVVNEVEAAMLVPGAGDHAAEATALVALGPRLAVVTLGPAGGFHATRGGARATPFAAFPAHVVDTVGAGDSFCGALAVALAEGRETADAIRFASASAAITVTRAGAAPAMPARVEVEALLARG